MSKLKFKIFARKDNNCISLLVGVTHNSKKSLNFVNSIINSDLTKFDRFLIELNIDNFYFLNKNKIKFSEFSPILDENKNKIVLIDMNIEKEIKEYSNTAYNLFENVLQYKLDRFLYYKIRNIISSEKIHFNNLSFFNTKFFHQSHITKREQHMVNKISEHLDSNKNNLIIVGISHFEFIEEFLNNNNTKTI